jgi:hypothetical protein
MSWAVFGHHHPHDTHTHTIRRRAVIVQLGFFFHMRFAAGDAALVLTRPVAFATAFMLLFSLVIALFKDIPDVKGDEAVRGWWKGGGRGEGGSV